MVLPSANLSQFIENYTPVGEDERRLLQSLADTEWRLLRIPALEMGVYAVGRLEFAGSFANEDEAVRKHLIEAQVFLAYQRQLNNLSIQESRLRRQREKDAAALRELQAKRKQQAKARLDIAARQYIRSAQQQPHQEFDPATFGFEFSLTEIKLRALDLAPSSERQLADAA